jgi:hypothetical protein
MSKAKRLIPIAAMAVATIALTGCSGINASHSVSPASFFLPGLIQHEVKPAVSDPMCAPAEQVALLVVPIN